MGAFGSGSFEGNYGCDPDIDPSCLNEPGAVIITTVVVETSGTAADAASVDNSLLGVGDILAALKGLMGSILSLIAGILGLLKSLWDNWIKPAIQALQKALKWLHDKLAPILKKISDWQKAQRQLLLDFYNKFIRPILQVIQTIRVIIHLLDLLHIHILDALDRELAKIQGYILKPFYLALYRLNTLGGLFGYMLNTYGLIYRSLFLSTLTANRGGAFGILASEPANGFTMLPPLGANAGNSLTAPYSSFQQQADTTYANAITQFSAGNPTVGLGALTAGTSTPQYDAAVVTVQQQLQSDVTVSTLS